VVNIIGIIVFNVEQEWVRFLIVFMMIIYNLFFSPLNTLLYQYIIPSLDKDESKCFIVWEKYESIGFFLASILGFFILKFDLTKFLLPLDGLTFLICAFIIDKNWESKPEINEYEVSEKRTFSIRNLLQEDFKLNVLLFSLVSSLIFVFAIDSHSYNLGILFFKELNITAVYIPLIMSAVSLTNLLGTFIFEKYLIKKNIEKLHSLSLCFLSVFLIIIGMGISFSLPLVTFLGLLLLQVLAPVWSTTNQIMVRKEVSHKHYGEFFGYFRILRSLFTFGGIFLYGLAQEHLYLKEFVYFGSLIILFPLIFVLPNIFSLKRKEISC
jgi:hypothetical protein